MDLIMMMLDTVVGFSGIFNPFNNMTGNLITQFLKIATNLAILGIIICGLGALFGSDRSKEKFKSGLVIIFIAFIVIVSARVLIPAIKGFF